MAAFSFFFIFPLLLTSSMPSPSNAFFGVGPFCCASSFMPVCPPHCFFCCPSPRPYCPPPPPPFPRPFCCSHCRLPSLAPVPCPCTAAAWHSVARRGCPSVSSHYLPSAPFVPHQQFLPFPPHGHQLPPMGTADQNAIGASSFVVGSEKAAQFPAEEQHQIQPVIYVIENGGGGGRFMPMANESLDEKLPAKTNETTIETVVEEESAKTTSEGTFLLGSEDEQQNNSTERTTKKVALKRPNLKRKTNLGISPSKRVTIAKTTAAEGKRQKTKAKQFDEGQMESAAQPLYDSEETKNEEETAQKSWQRRDTASPELVEIGTRFPTRRNKIIDKILEVLELKERESNLRRKRISNDESVLNVCNNVQMARIMGSAIVEEISISKQLVKRALEYSFPNSKFDVICATGGVFSYAVYGRQHCKVKRKGVTCLAYDD